MTTDDTTPVLLGGARTPFVRFNGVFAGLRAHELGAYAIRAASSAAGSRRPRVLPVFAERATVKAGRRDYLATVYLDSEVSEANPGEIALAWVEFVLPADKWSLALN